MKPKKNPEISLENKKRSFLSDRAYHYSYNRFLAFEWKSYDKTDYNLGQLNLDDLEEEIIPITKQGDKTTPHHPHHLLKLLKLLRMRLR